MHPCMRAVLVLSPASKAARDASHGTTSRYAPHSTYSRHAWSVPIAHTAAHWWSVRACVPREAVLLHGALGKAHRERQISASNPLTSTRAHAQVHGAGHVHACQRSLKRARMMCSSMHVQYSSRLAAQVLHRQRHKKARKTQCTARSSRFVRALATASRPRAARRARAQAQYACAQALLLHVHEHLTRNSSDPFTCELRSLSCTPLL